MIDVRRVILSEDRKQITFKMLDNLVDIPSCLPLIPFFHFVRAKNIRNIVFDFGDLNFIEPIGIAMLASIINQLRNDQRTVVCAISRCPIKSYLSRMNFFSNINVEYFEANPRRLNRNLVELTPIKTIEPQYCQLDDLSRRFRDVLCANISHEGRGAFYSSFDWTISELLGNVLTYATPSPDSIFNTCFFVAQFIPGGYFRRPRLCMSIIDNGPGIRKTMLRSPVHRETVEGMSMLDTIEFALRKGVTAGGGAGNGLYYTKRIVDANQGRISIFSKNAIFEVVSGEARHTLNIPEQFKTWDGTIVDIELYPENMIILEEVFQESPQSIPDSYLYNEMFE